MSEEKDIQQLNAEQNKIRMKLIKFENLIGCNLVKCIMSMLIFNTDNHIVIKQMLEEIK